MNSDPGSPRFVGAVRVADIVDGVLPESKKLQRVLCTRISETGITYIAKSETTATSVVVASSSGPLVDCKVAKILHRHESELYGHARQSIDCEFAETVKLGDNGEFVR